MAYGSVNVPGKVEDLVGFGTPTATVDANVGTPSVEVQASGPDKAKVFKFIFKNLKGLKGDTGTAAGFGAPTASVDANVGTPSVTVTASGANTAKVFNFAFKNLKGATGPKGDPGVMYGTCSTAATTAAKVVTLSGFTLATGKAVLVKFTYSNDAASPTLNVNGTGAKPIMMYGTTAGRSGIWGEGRVVLFVYDGTNWVMQNPSFVEGDSTASGIFSHAEGFLTIASGYYSHAEGSNTTASGGSGSHAEGSSTLASGNESHAEGSSTEASGRYSHAEGVGSTASGTASHAEGEMTTAAGNRSHAEGVSTKTYHKAQMAIGQYNVSKTVSVNTFEDIFTAGKGTSNSARANAFRVSTAGVYGTAAFNASGADYAELCEWLDGNPDAEDRCGRFVTLDGEKIRLAGPEDDYILGIVSGAPSVVGDVHDDQWQGMFMTDVFGRFIYEDVMVPDETVEEPDPENPEQTVTRVIIPAHMEHRQKVNPDYDHTQPYVPRTERPEWDAVGMVGKLVAVDDGTCQVNGWATVGAGGVATLSDVRTKYRVMARLDETHIRVMIL